ncbi:hypothetical protein P170DRAFT_510939 [Aspergillus steynii IBT 23096]|uniref:Zn(2)-C6 fungal-type domain-containing protein n=1 Tax=Aspergillus steynii IBT 23096 TaxID=1392250 RepID=A0A2I2G603_9EURO|nr:uncharacterized protein P170DRAFT_510939 [Aspergillus steynii IBT 23096]PLB48305.1 hypothetical protein P170DRAFT_510939 [Aspergillus steynii IBT 23096]
MPRSRKRGKPRRSCDSCARMKFACQGNLPCSSCQANSLVCTYDRLRIDSSSRPRSQRDSGDPGNPIVSSASQPPTDDLLKLRIPFLLNYYSTGNSSSGFYRALESGRLKSNPDYVSSAPSYESDATQLELFDEELLRSDGPLSSNLSCIKSAGQRNTRQRLSLYRDRGMEMVQELRKVAESHEPSLDGTLSHSLNTAVSQGLFSGANIIIFTQLYFERLHRHCPILHASSFRIDSVSLPLLLAIFLSGSILSHPRDTFDLALGCFDLAEEFIFASISSGLSPQKKQTDREMSTIAESLIAAVIFINLQMGRNDKTVRLKLCNQHFPVLLDTARSLRLFQLSHNTGLSSQTDDLEFILNETLIRTSTYMFLLDCQFAMCIGSSSSIAIDELICDLPCSELEFSIGDPASHSSTNPSGDHRLSLKSFLGLLMNSKDDRYGDNNPALQRTSIFGLFAIVCGLLISIRAAFHTRTIQHERTRFQRALSRWNSIWDALVPKISADELAMVGFMSCAKEIWLLTQALLRLDPGEYLNGAESSLCVKPSSLPVDSAKKKPRPCSIQRMVGPEFWNAVWHAGRIIRRARIAPPARLREFCAVPIYQASLTLWAYGLMSWGMSGVGSVVVVSINEVTRVFLDGPEGPDSIAFVMLGKGQPGISTRLDGSFAPLMDIQATMNAACHVFRRNFGVGTECLPLLLDGMMNLMTELGV